MPASSSQQQRQPPEVPCRGQVGLAGPSAGSRGAAPQRHQQQHAAHQRQERWKPPPELQVRCTGVSCCRRCNSLAGVRRGGVARGWAQPASTGVNRNCQWGERMTPSSIGRSSPAPQHLPVKTYLFLVRKLLRALRGASGTCIVSPVFAPEAHPRYCMRVQVLQAHPRVLQA